MKIIKRDGTKVDFNPEKIRIAMEKAFRSVNNPIEREVLEEMTSEIEEIIKEKYPKYRTPRWKKFKI